MSTILQQALAIMKNRSIIENNRALVTVTNHLQTFIKSHDLQATQIIQLVQV